MLGCSIRIAPAKETGLQQPYMYLSNFVLLPRTCISIRQLATSKSRALAMSLPNHALFVLSYSIPDI